MHRWNIIRQRLFYTTVICGPHVNYIFVDNILMCYTFHKLATFIIKDVGNKNMILLRTSHTISITDYTTQQYSINTDNMHIVKITLISTDIHYNQCTITDMISNEQRI